MGTQKGKSNKRRKSQQSIDQWVRRKSSAVEGNNGKPVPAPRPSLDGNESQDVPKSQTADLKTGATTPIRGDQEPQQEQKEVNNLKTAQNMQEASDLKLAQNVQADFDAEYHWSQPAQPPPAPPLKNMESDGPGSRSENSKTNSPNDIVTAKSGLETQYQEQQNDARQMRELPAEIEGTASALRHKNSEDSPTERTGITDYDNQARHEQEQSDKQTQISSAQFEAEDQDLCQKDNSEHSVDTSMTGYHDQARRKQEQSDEQMARKLSAQYEAEYQALQTSVTGYDEQARRKQEQSDEQMARKLNAEFEAENRALPRATPENISGSTLAPPLSNAAQSIHDNPDIDAMQPFHETNRVGSTQQMAHTTVESNAYGLKASNVPGKSSDNPALPFRPAEQMGDTVPDRRDNIWNRLVDGLEKNFFSTEHLRAADFY